MELWNKYKKLYLQYCRHGRRLSENSLKAYDIDLEQFFTWMQEQDSPLPQPHEVDRLFLRLFFYAMNDSFAASTVKRKAASLRGFFSFLEEEELITRTPFHKLELHIKEPRKLPKTLTLPEVKQILAAAYEYHCALPSPVSELLHYRDVAILEMLFAGGMRVQELCRLRWEDLDLVDKTLKLQGKGNKERWVCLEHPEVLRALKDYLKILKKCEIKSETIFINRFGKPITEQTVRLMVQRCAKQAGIKRNITPHAFRHTFATLLLDEGVDIRYIQEFLGHSSISTTQIYLHVSKNTAKTVLREHHPRNHLKMV